MYIEHINHLKTMTFIIKSYRLVLFETNIFFFKFVNFKIPESKLCIY